jgi:hypothetical protein
MKQHSSKVGMNLNIWFARVAFKMVTSFPIKDGNEHRSEPRSISVGCYVLIIYEFVHQISDIS